MKKFYFLAATAALVLSACSSDDELTQSSPTNGDLPVAFDSYMARQTRATNLVGNQNAAPNMLGIKENGFGVFAYDQDNQPVETYTKSFVTPNFFNNQLVEWNQVNFACRNIDLAKYDALPAGSLKTSYSENGTGVYTAVNSTILKAEYDALGPAERAHYTVANYWDGSDATDLVTTADATHTVEYDYNIVNSTLDYTSYTALSTAGKALYSETTPPEFASSLVPTAAEYRALSSAERACVTSTPAPDGYFKYENIKYWPNNPGSMLSFYAYAPYMETLPTDPVTEGCRLVLSGANNGPAIQYIMPKNLADAVDLCWGQEYLQETAPVNKEKPSITDRTKFNFKHAMARYGFNIQVWSDRMTDNYPDPTDHEPNGEGNQNIASNTTIKVESVKLIGTFAKEGVLRLYDGTWDAQIATTSEYELKPSFNPTVDAIVNDAAFKEIPLLTDFDTYVMMIPGARFKIQIKYTVSTPDANLVGGIHKKTNTLESELFTAKEGVATDFHLNLGMTTVKFDAVVTDWNNPADKIEVDLPANALEYITNIPRYDHAIINITDHFIGESTVEPATGTAGLYYYNTIDNTLYTSGASAWFPVTAPNCFQANYTIYTTTATSCTRTTAPKWIAVVNGSDYDYYQLVNNVYQPVDNYISPAKASVKALVMDNPATGLYWITDESALVYYVQQ